MQSTPGEPLSIKLLAAQKRVWDFVRSRSIRLRDKMARFAIGLFYENDAPSLTRLISAIAFFAFLIGSGYLMIKGQRWDHYETFAMLTGGGGAATQIANKVLNSVYNSPTDQFPDKSGGKRNGKDLY